MKQLVSDDLRETTIRKAKYGHKDWIYYKFPNGEQYAEAKSKASLDVAMLNIIQGGPLTLVFEANYGTGCILDEDIVTNMQNHLKYGI